MCYWEPELVPNGSIACGVVMANGAAAGFAEADGNFLLLGKVEPGKKTLVHYIGAGWSKSGDFPEPAAWEAYVREFAMRLKSPLVVKLP